MKAKHLSCFRFSFRFIALMWPILTLDRLFYYLLVDLFNIYVALMRIQSTLNRVKKMK